MKKLAFVLLFPVFGPLSLITHFLYEPWMNLCTPGLLTFMSDFLPFLILPGHWSTPGQLHEMRAGSEAKKLDHWIVACVKDFFFLLFLPIMSPMGFVMRIGFEPWAELLD